MLYKFFIGLFLILILPLSVQAHTTLLSSNPAEGENITQALEKVELVFGTRIEEGSSMSLVGESESVEFDRITVEEDVMAGELNEPLQSGSYRILWKIIGEDGHPIEGEIAFTVSMKTEEEAASPVEAEEPAEQSVAASEQEAASATTTEGGSNVLVTIMIVLIVVLLVFGIYKVLMKKK